MPEWHTTGSSDVAMSGDYIGEVVVVPTFIAQEISQILHSKMPKPFMMYYYGTPDNRLKEMFGYA